MSSDAYDEQRSQSMKTAIAIIMTNVSGGGTPRHAFEMARAWSHQGEDVLFIQTFRRLSKVYFYKEGKVQHVIRFWDEDGCRLLQLLKAAHVGMIHVEHLLDAEPWMKTLHRALHVPLVVTMHDYYFICPFIKLTDEHDMYCGERGEADCNACLERREFTSPTMGCQVKQISSWRNCWLDYLKEASLILVPSKDMKERVQRYFSLDTIQMRENPELIHPKRDAIHIGLLGSLSVAKGAQVIKKCLSYIAENHLPIRLTLFGTLNEVTLSEDEKKQITITGPYKEEKVYGMIRGAGIDFFWFPGVWPETYSYTLSIPIRLHIPCLASDLGAIASRIHSHHWGETYPWEAGTDEIVHRLLAFDYHRYANPDFTIENTSFSSVEDFYRGVPYKREEPCDEEQVAFPTAFSELPAILHREEFNELWQGASLFQKVQLLTHMDRDWLLSVWQKKGAGYFLGKVREKVMK